ncbi:hypothetical protein PGT21_004347 [Puccinia graminis f. sp. tritici]|uniref:Secreted protein n=1 Tax=Puccinia graminis f. sp. tritici TaxID=56615 RepID=A0A5B0REC1_PUCGR|nr:hypothetical protein PGT21_004347 [Puccinia graminis f. sp. tritici]KAA1123809.1 hypothetical protein PGTUg99_022175 [Puccinia graminis f. sp. tritici]
MHYSLFSVSLYFIGLVTTSISSPYPPPIGGEKTLKCTRYSNITGPNTTCNDDPHQVCTGGCTGTVVASQCTKEGDPSDHSEQQMCTISYSQPSLERGVCINDQGTFSCQGIPQGEATCSGCAFVANGSDAGVAQISNSSHADSVLSGTKTPLSLSTAALPTGSRLTLFGSSLFGLIGILALIL